MNKINIITVVLASEENTIKSLTTAIISLLENANITTSYEIYILSENQYSTKNINTIINLQKKYKNHSISFVEIEKTEKDKAILVSNKLPKLNKCIYLNHNVVVQKDLSELYNTDLKDNYIAGVKDENGINQNVMLVNSALIRQDKVEEISEKTMLIEPKYNLRADYFIEEKSFNFTKQIRMKSVLKNLFDMDELKTALRDNVIFSYTDEVNPLNSCGCSFIDVWSRYAKLVDVDNTKMNTIHVAFVSDENYAMPLSVSIVSLLENADLTTEYNIYVLTANDFSKDIKEKVLSIKNVYSRCSITFIEVETQFKDVTVKSQVTKAAYYRLLLSSLLPEVDKCIYLDCDIIVQKDLLEMFNTDVSNHYIAGSRDTYAIDVYGNEFAKEIGLPKIDGYVNSGVLLFNLENMRKNDVQSKFMELTKQYFRLHVDQDIINLACYGNIKHIPLKYNLQVGLYRIQNNGQLVVQSWFSNCCDKEEIFDSVYNNVILHYSAQLKPWNDKRCNVSEIWWHYHSLSPFNDQNKLYYKKVIKNTTENNFVKNGDNIVNLDFSYNEKPTEGVDFYETRKIFADSFNPKKIIISILTWNQLEKTKRCVQYLLKYTSHIDFDLVFFDNNSDDDTIEYLKSVEHPNKIIFSTNKNMGISFALNYLISTSKCEYYININNDCYVTENWLDNILECFKSDEKIAFITPMSSNMSNFQDPQIKFNNLKEMQEKASQFNKLDPTKWKERYRLIGAVTCYRKHIFDLIGIMDSGFIHNFSDDDISIRIARSGYKQILVGDVFIHHDHDHSKQDQEKFKKVLSEGRENFIKKYKDIDAWEDLANYEIQLISFASYEKDNNNILGIDVKCGVPLLEIKNKLREKSHLKTNISAFSTNAKYYTDLTFVCDNSQNVVCDRINFINEYYIKNSFDYIILGEYLNGYDNPLDLMENLVGLLNYDGQLLLKLNNTDGVNSLIDEVKYKMEKNSHKCIVREMNNCFYLKILNQTLK